MPGTPPWLLFLRTFPDRGVRALLEAPGDLIAALELVDPEAARCLVPGSIRLVPSEFLDDLFRERAVDRRYEAEIRLPDGSVHPIVIVLEHQSAPSKWFPLRALLSTAGQWENERRRSRRRRPARLSPVLSFLVYTGARAWPRPASWSALLPPAFADRAPALAPLYLDVKHCLPGILRRSEHLVAALLLAVREEHSTPGRFRRAAAGAMARIRKVPVENEHEWRLYLRFLVALACHRRPAKELDGIFRVAASTMDSIRREEVLAMKTGLSELEERLIEEGKEQGRLLACRDYLIRVIRAKFGSVPRPAQAAIRRTSDREVLERWLERTIAATRLADVGIE